MLFLLENYSKIDLKIKFRVNVFIIFFPLIFYVYFNRFNVIFIRINYGTIQFLGGAERNRSVLLRVRKPTELNRYIRYQ